MTAVREKTSNERKVVMKDKPEDAERLADLDEWFGKIERPRPAHCPKCGSERALSIVYGLPAEVDPTPVEERDYVLGGCYIDSDSPRWHCGACGHEWG
jgi:hypothetical protein